MFDMITCHEAQTNAERKIGIMRALLRWMIVFSVVNIAFALVSGVAGWEPWEDIFPILTAASLRIVLAVIFLVVNPPYPYGNLLLVALSLVLSSIIIFDTEAVETGRFLIYLILPMILAGAILHPASILIVSAMEIALVIVFVAAMGQVQTWLWYALVSYVFIAIIMYTTAHCLHTLINRLSVANEIRKEVINGVAESYKMVVGETDVAHR